MENGMIYVKFPSVLNMPTYDGRNDLSYTNRNRLLFMYGFSVLNMSCDSRND